MTPNYKKIWSPLLRAVKLVIINTPIKQEIFLERLSALRDRIEDWCNKFGYENQDNYAERRNTDGKIVWHKSDWEYVDGMHNTVYNSQYNREGEDGFGNDYSYNDETLMGFNKMWRRYEI
tara:strand:+ start:216 stop:575 length:360 start_codon:yes stop_codon:yes gene_type:complete